MPKKRSNLDRLTDLSWHDLEEWFGSKIVSRGKQYQRSGRVCDLAVMKNDSLIAWVEGTKRYATKVVMDDEGLPEVACTCPYDWDCKHGVAVVIEYLKRIEDRLPVPEAKVGDARLKLVEDVDGGDACWEGEAIDEEMADSKKMRAAVDDYLKGKTKAQLLALIHEIAQEHFEVAQALADRRQLASGDTKRLVKRLRREIHEIGAEPGWQDYWRGGGYTPDYSGIYKQLEALLEAGQADEVLALGRELVDTGIRQVEESHDEGETMMEIAACMPVIVKALDRSSLDPVDKLNWALDAELKDSYELCEAFSEYLHRKHSESAWHTLADRLLLRLKEMKASQGLHEFNRNYERDRLSDWAIHALDRAGRKDEIIGLCETEAKRTGNYERLVERLVSARRYEEAERWILEGVRSTKNKYPGIAMGLRNTLRLIRTRQKNWPEVAAMHVEDFIRYPSRQAFTDCKKAAAKVKAWPKIRESLLRYLEKGVPPWKIENWPLPNSGLDVPETRRQDQFPMVGHLIEVALVEKKPEQVLYWFDRLPKNPYRRYGVNDDEVATAVQTYAPDRAVAIWKRKAEGLIAHVKPKAYQEAGKYLRKAAKIMVQEGERMAWDRYLQSLREHHARKVRLMEVLDNLDDKPIVKKRRPMRSS